MAIHRIIIATCALSIMQISACPFATAQGVRGFGPPVGKLPLRGFGNPTGEEALRRQFPEAAAAITGDDRSLVQSQFSRTDGNGDGVVTEAEFSASGYQKPTQFFYYDLNGDGRLTVYEHSIGIARWRRRNERRADERTSAERAARRQPESLKSTAALRPPPLQDPQVRARESQIRDLSAYVIRVYDINGDEVIERAEFKNQKSQFGDISSGDTNGDGRIERPELALWMQKRLPPLSKLALEFQSSDHDQDGQVSLSEYAPSLTDASIADFNRWDRNRDGFITPQESQTRQAPLANEYANEEAFVIKPNAAIVSSIWIEQDLIIRDLDVHVAITKENDNFTEIYLMAPDGRRATLFPGDGYTPWRGALILKGVTFNDDAAAITQTLAQPPYPRSLRPPGVAEKGAPSLVDFNGLSTHGSWRLVVRNQNNRVGLLVRWSLIVTPAKEDGR